MSGSMKRMKIFNWGDDELPTTIKHNEDAPEMNAGMLADFFIFFLQLPPSVRQSTFYCIIIIIILSDIRLLSSLFSLPLL